MQSAMNCTTPLRQNTRRRGDELHEMERRSLCSPWLPVCSPCSR